MNKEIKENLIREWCGKINQLRRTDDTQMSHDHTYDEALDDVIALLNKKELCPRCKGMDTNCTWGK